MVMEKNELSALLWKLRQRKITPKKNKRLVSLKAAMFWAQYREMNKQGRTAIIEYSNEGIAAW